MLARLAIVLLRTRELVAAARHTFALACQHMLALLLHSVQLPMGMKGAAARE